MIGFPPHSFNRKTRSIGSQSEMTELKTSRRVLLVFVRGPGRRFLDALKDNVRYERLRSDA